VSSSNKSKKESCILKKNRDTCSDGIEQFWTLFEKSTLVREFGGFDPFETPELITLELYQNIKTLLSPN